MGNAIFQERVKELRAKHGLTMEELGKQLGGVSKSRVNMWEFNGTVPREDVLVKLAQFFGVSIDYLLGNEGDEGIKSSNHSVRMLQRKSVLLTEGEAKKANELLDVLFPKLRGLGEDEDDI